MRLFRFAVLCALTISALLIPARSATVSASTDTAASVSKSKCHTVTKKKHGKKVKVRVCTKVAPKPKPLPKTVVSKTDPFASCTSRGDGATKNYPNTAIEPSAAISAKDPKSMVTVWQQDPWNSGAARGVVAGYTSDSGKTWNETPLPFTSCGPSPASVITKRLRLNSLSGADSRAVILPLDQVDSADIVYVNGVFVAGSDPYDINSDGSNTQAILASRSTDGGKSFGKPIILDSVDGSLSDFFIHVEIHPIGDRIGFGYNRFHDDGKNGVVTSYFVTCKPDLTGCTTPLPFPNDGSTVLSSATFATFGNTFYRLFAADGGPFNQSTLVMQSYNGSAFGSFEPIAPFNPPPLMIPGTQKEFLGAAMPDLAVDPNGKLFVVWDDSRWDILATSSTDGGATWSKPVQVSNGGLGLFFSVTADAGHLMTVYDFLNPSGISANSLPFSVNVAESKDGGATFTTRSNIFSFDGATGPTAGTNANLIFGLGNDQVPVPGKPLDRVVVGDGNRVTTFDQVM